MYRADENLRIGAAAVGALNHLFANVAFAGDVDLMEAYAFTRKQVLGVCAIRAVLHGIDVDGRHDPMQSSANSYMDVRTGSATLAKTSTSTLAAPARSSARA